MAVRANSPCLSLCPHKHKSVTCRLASTGSILGATIGRQLKEFPICSSEFESPGENILLLCEIGCLSSGSQSSCLFDDIAAFTGISTCLACLLPGRYLFNVFSCLAVIVEEENCLFLYYMRKKIRERERR